MKILYVVSNLEKCGPINVLFNILKEASIDNSCTIITLSSENSRSMLFEFKKYDVSIIQLNMKRNLKKESYKTKLKSIVEDINPDIIHSHGYRSDRYINLINKECSFQHITTLHNFPFSDYPKFYGLLPGILLSFCHLYIVRRIKHKIACSYSIAKKFNILNMKKVSVIQNGVDIEEFKSMDKKKKESLRKNLNLPEDKKIVISTGAIIKRKRPIKLIKAFSNGKWENKVLFIVLGDGKLYNKIEKYRTENIIILGSTNNIAEYLQASDVFISNSKAEGLPMAMLEAAATGLIIVGSKIEPHKEIRNLYKEKTILFKGQKIKTIIKKIDEALIESERCSNSLSKYSLSSKNMANKYLLFYQNVKVD